jgi:FMN phosphatase YigB (HAD superfamily)
MPAIQHIFLDDGGVINDNSRRQPQWRQLVGEFFPPRLGGTAGQWSAANVAIFPGVWERFSARLAAWDEASSDYKRELDIYNIDWLCSMCSIAGIDPPESDDACLSLADEATRFIVPRVRADFPGAIDTVRWLAERYPVRTASNGASFELQTFYEPLGIMACFERLYGPDLVQQPKTSRRFYDRVFAHAGVDPATALVLDDNPSCIGWAREAGARAILVSPNAPSTAEASVIAKLSDLPAVLEKWP